MFCKYAKPSALGESRAQLGVLGENQNTFILLLKGPLGAGSRGRGERGMFVRKLWIDRRGAEAEGM